jgi:hypothetical protein
MKKLISLLIILIISTQTFSQHMQIDWQSCYGGTDKEYAFDIIEIPNGYILSGGTKSLDGDITFNHGKVDIWLIKTDLTGNLIWQKTYGGTNSEAGSRIFNNIDGTFYIIGESSSSNGDISIDPYPGSTDYWVVKIDSLGEIIWERILGGSGFEQLWTGATTSDGGIVAFGWTNSDDGDVSNYYGYYDIWLIKLNSEGEVLWDQTIGNNYFDWGQAIIETSDKGFLVGGTSYFEQGGNLSCDSYQGELDAALVKLDSLGNIEWQQCYGGSYDESYTAILEIEDGYVLAGYTTSNDGNVSGWHAGYDHLGNRQTDIWAVKINIDGAIQWQQCLGGSDAEFCQSILETSDGDLIFTGYTQSNDGDVSGNHSNSEHNNDIWMVKLSSEGELLWQQCFGGVNDEKVNFGVIQKSDYRYIIAGQTAYGPSYDVQCNYHLGDGAWPDFWVFEVYDTTVSVHETPGNISLKTYPNPANNYVIFEIPVIHNNSAVISTLTEEGEKSPQHNPQPNPTITITNTLGQQVARLEIKDTKTVWNTRKVQAGVYFYFAKLAGKRYSGKVVVQK